MKKTIKTIDKIYLVVTEEQNQFYDNYKEAEREAKDLCDISCQEVELYEISKAWRVYYPEEPEPEAEEVSLSDFA